MYIMEKKEIQSHISGLATSQGVDVRGSGQGRKANGETEEKSWYSFRSIHLDSDLFVQFLYVDHRYSTQVIAYKDMRMLSRYC